MVARTRPVLIARFARVSSAGKSGASRIASGMANALGARKMPKSKLTPEGIASVRLGGKKKRDYAESRLQAEIVKTLSLFGVFAMMVPNGEITDMSARKYQRLVAMGFRLGAPDLLLFSKKENRFFGMELKQPGGTQSPGQVTFQEKCIQNNWPYVVVDSVDAALKAAKEWGLCR